MNNEPSTSSFVGYFFLLLAAIISVILYIFILKYFSPIYVFVSINFNVKSGILKSIQPLNNVKMPAYCVYLIGSAKDGFVAYFHCARISSCENGTKGICVAQNISSSYVTGASRTVGGDELRLFLLLMVSVVPNIHICSTARLLCGRVPCFKARE